MIQTTFPTEHKTINIDGLNIFYREAGDPKKPTLLLLHGFPTSSHMFRNLIRDLSDQFHLVAPDYPGYGMSDMPTVSEFNYTFDHLSNIVEQFVEKLSLNRYTLYLMDYGAPIGYRLATKHPERVEGLIIQNGNAYEEGLLEFWKPFRTYWQDQTEANAEPLKKFLEVDITEWQYTHGTKYPERISPDNWLHDQSLLDRPGNKDIQLQLFYDYQSNIPLYPQWQEYFRTHQPPALVIWGKNDYIFPGEGAEPYKRDLKNLDFHLLDAGHFVLEELGDEVTGHIQQFINTKVMDKKDACAV